jgi:hypothetical protein
MIHPPSLSKTLPLSAQLDLNNSLKQKNNKKLNPPSPIVIATKETPKQKNKSILSKTIRYGAAFVGIAAACYAAYNIALKTLTPPHPLEHNAFTGPLENMLEQTKDYLLLCPQAKELWEDVQKERPFTLKNAEINIQGQAVEHVTRIPFFNWIIPGMEEYEIRLSNKIKDHERVAVLLFELNNIDQMGVLGQLSSHACHYTPDEYAETIERSEFLSGQRTYQVSEQCVNRGIWPKSWHLYEESFKFRKINFEDVLKSQILNEHTYTYWKQWYNKCQPRASQYEIARTWHNFKDKHGLYKMPIS